MVSQAEAAPTPPLENGNAAEDYKESHLQTLPEAGDTTPLKVLRSAPSY